MSSYDVSQVWPANASISLVSDKKGNEGAATAHSRVRVKRVKWDDGDTVGPMDMAHIYILYTWYVFGITGTMVFLLS